MTTSNKAPSLRHLLPVAGILYLLGLFGLIYLYLHVPADLTQYKYWAPRPHHSTEVAALYRQALGLPYHPVSETVFHFGNLALIVLIFVSYGLALWSACKNLNMRWIIVLSGLMGLLALLIPPFYATDIYYYSITGQITGVYHQNPYFQAPGLFPNSVFFPFNFWVDITSPYGPLWTSFSGIVARLSGAHLFWTPLAFKLVNSAALWGCAALIRRIWRETYPTAAAWGVVLFLWNPLVLLETVANGHNDILMAFFVVLGAYYLIKQRPLAGFAAAVLAAWIKYLPAPLAIWSFLIRLRPHNTRKLHQIGLYAAIFIVLTTFVWLPHWKGIKTVSSLFAESARGLSGPIAFVMNLLGELFSFDPILPITVLFIILFVSMLAWGGWRLYHLFRQPITYTPQDEAIDWAMIYAWLVVVLPGAHPWYAIPILVLLASFYNHAPRRAMYFFIFFSFWFFYRAVAWG